MSNRICLTLFAAVFSTGCAANQDLVRRIDDLERRNENLSRQLKLQGGSDDGLVEDDEESVKIDLTGNAAVPGTAVPGTGTGTGTDPNVISETTETYDASAWVKRSHGAYLCFVGNDPHVSEANKIVLKNSVGSSVYLNFTVNEQPVIVLAPAGYNYRPMDAGNGVTVLPPGKSCYLEAGGAKQYVFTAYAYRNRGSVQAPMLDVEANAAAVATVTPRFDRKYVTYTFEGFEFKEQ